MIEVRIRPDLGLVKETLRTLLVHHDELRARFEQGVGGWVQQIEGDDLQEIPFRVVDLSEVAAENQAQKILAEAEIAQASLDIGAPPLIRSIYFDLGENQSHRLLFIFHHLVFDGVSARIILEDFLSVYLQLMNGSPVQLPPKTTSYRAWCEKLQDTAQSDPIRNQLDYWLQNTSVIPIGFPLDHPDGQNSYGLVDQVTLSLSPTDTAELVTRIPGLYKVSVNAVLLTALARTWTRIVGSTGVFVELEGHGREQVAGTPIQDVDLSRTVGWFTAIYPFNLQLPVAAALESQLRQVADQLKGIPERGVGYGLLRYLNSDPHIREQIAAIPQPQINFNYLGQFEGSGIDSQSQPVDFETLPFKIVNEPTGMEQSPQNQRTTLLDVVAVINANQLGIRWSFSRGKFNPETVQRIAAAYMDELWSMITEARAAIGVESGASLADQNAVGQEDILAGMEEFGWSTDDLADILGAIDDSASDPFNNNEEEN